MVAEAFDPSKLESYFDVVQRAGITDKRRRAETVRKGLTDQGTFQSDFSTQISDITNPKDEFLGAGRRLAENQQVDQSIMDLFKGPLTKHSDGVYVYGPDDYSTAQFGTQGYRTEDIGEGKYNIFGKDNSLLGVGYKGLSDSISEIAKSNLEKSIKEIDYSTPSDNIYGFTNESKGYVSDYLPGTYSNFSGDSTPQQIFSSREEILNNLLSSFPTSYNRPVASGGDLELWEVLGQVLGGGTVPKPPIDGNVWRYFPRNYTNETISGKNTLYGTLPLLFKDKLLGYQLDTTPIDESTVGYQNPNYVARLDLKGDKQSNFALARQWSNPDSWKSIASKAGDGKVLIKPEDVDKIPGWTNYETGEVVEKDSGFLGGLGGILGSVLSFIPGLQPLGAMISMINAASTGNILGVIGSLVGMSGFNPFGGGMDPGSINAVNGMDLASDLASGVSPSLASQFTTGLQDISGSLGISPQALMSGGLGAIGSLVQGGNPITGGITGGLAQMFGDTTGLGNIGSTAAKFGLSSLFNKNNKQTGSEQVQQFLNTVPYYNMGQQATNEKKEEPVDVRKLMALSQLYRNTLNG